MTTTARSTPLDPGTASAAASHAATTIQQWFRGSVNLALSRAMFDGPYSKISETGKQRLERELNRILAVAERSLQP
jgi:hypothetical protein